MVGLERGTVRLEPYQKEWQALFAQEKEQLLAAVGGIHINVHHVGSTAIPGLPAKPILDILILVEEDRAAQACIVPITALGYEYRGEAGLPGRLYFVKGDPVRTHHIHLFQRESEDARRVLVFRDYLTRHPKAAQAYADLKIRLAGQFPSDRDAYLAGKTDFVLSIVRQAQAETGEDSPGDPHGEENLSGG